MNTFIAWYYALSRNQAENPDQRIAGTQWEYDRRRLGVFGDGGGFVRQRIFLRVLQGAVE